MSKSKSDDRSRASGLLSGGRFTALIENVVEASVMVPAFIVGQLAYGLIGTPSWELCFGLCIGGFTFAIADGIARRRAR